MAGYNCSFAIVFNWLINSSLERFNMNLYDRTYALIRERLRREVSSQPPKFPWEGDRSGDLSSELDSGILANNYPDNENDPASKDKSKS
jgi:hypothetical protein